MTAVACGSRAAWPSTSAVRVSRGAGGGSGRPGPPRAVRCSAGPIAGSSPRGSSGCSASAARKAAKPSASRSRVPSRNCAGSHSQRSRIRPPVSTEPSVPKPSSTNSARSYTALLGIDGQRPKVRPAAVRGPAGAMCCATTTRAGPGVPPVKSRDWMMSSNGSAAWSSASPASAATSRRYPGNGWSSRTRSRSGTRLTK